jgi:hypothetical protein
VAELGRARLSADSQLQRRNIPAGPARFLALKTSRLSDRVSMDVRCWKPGGDPTETAKEISKYIADSGSADATIVASDEL